MIEQIERQVILLQNETEHAFRILTRRRGLVVPKVGKKESRAIVWSLNPYLNIDPSIVHLPKTATQNLTAHRP